MKGDFTRDTFDATKHFTQVLMQQGRVQLDADWNEQASILLHYLQALAEDLIGPYGGPAKIARGGKRLDNEGFKIGLEPPSGGKLTDLTIGLGRYYVDGILCENDKDGCTYFTQDDFPRDKKEEEEQLQGVNFLVYLDVWERLITYREDDAIREVALGGPDTAARAKIVWQVKVDKNLPASTPLMPAADASDDDWREWVVTHWFDWVKSWQPQNRGLLTAQAKEDPQQNVEACATPPEAHYLGLENQLYRVEVHKGGKIGDKPTFKWSRENGSVCFSILKTAGKRVYVEHLGRDERFSLKKDDWVEIVDDTLVLGGQAGLLLQVDEVDPLDMVVTLRVDDDMQLREYDEHSTIHPLLRRWESGAVPIDETNSSELENDIVIQFHQADPADPEHDYCTGDYWLIPARTATGDVEWPGPVGAPEPRPPHGVDHHYAPLAVVVGVKAHGVRTRFSITLT